MKETGITPDQIQAVAEKRAQEICESLANFMANQKITKADMANAIGVKRQNINSMIDPNRKSTLHSLLLIQAGLEALTGVPFEAPRFTQVAKPK
jgi:hypothetical protein